MLMRVVPKQNNINVSCFLMATSLAAILLATLGSLTLLILLLTFLLWFFMSQFRHLTNKDSETGSSDPSAVEIRRGPIAQEGRQFRMEELEQASKQLNESNLIGFGTFGQVFKGLLCDGTVVAIKRRTGPPRHEFSEEVAHLCGIHHRNLVALLGYCQEEGNQMLVFEYLPNGSICRHLYDTGKDSSTKLEFKQRLSIAIGAAKGLCHLHGLQPPLIHSNFKTSNVLVDESFTAKVADAGLFKLLQKPEQTASSCSPIPSINAFRDPELGKHDTFQETSDVYSFGIFLLELMSGKEANYQEAFRSNHTILQWVQDQLSVNELIDHRLMGTFTEEGMKDLIRQMLKCIRFPGKERPRMEQVVSELDQILENEITRTTIMGEGTATVTLGSQLFMT